MNHVSKLLQILCRRVGSPFAGRVYDLARRGEWQELQKLSVDPTSYHCPEAYWADAQCIDLVRKMALEGTDTKLAAVTTFLETERDCYRVNRYIRTLSHNTGLTLSDCAFLDFLDRWKVKIRYVLGSVPEVLEPSFSGGSTTATSRLESTIFDKLSMTPERYGHSPEVVEHLFYSSRWGDIAHMRGFYPRIAPGNKYFTVPKNGLTDRSACMEAPVNLAYQLAVGKVIRKRLLKTLQIDLNHGASLHQARACEGSLYGNYATLDLSSASDRWARDLVSYILPSDWQILLGSLRATHTMFGSKRLRLEKYSSMGNGFTFELETVLFATLALTVRDDCGLGGEVLCYGDDLIVEPELYTPLSAWLSRVGHRVNQKKSFREGPFRESCGGDYHSGVAVSTAKPEKLPEEPSDWISLANSLRRVAKWVPARWALVKPAWEYCLKQLPSQIRACRGPEHLGSTVVHDDPQFWNRKASSGHVRTYEPVIATRSLSYYADNWTVLALGMIRSRDLRGRVPLRKVEGYRLRWRSPLFGSDWLPGDTFRADDPRLVSARVLLNGRMRG